MRPSMPVRIVPAGAPHAGQAPLRILLVDDDDFDRLAVRRCLQQCPVSVEMDEAVTAAETLERIDASAYDCVLLDYYLPGVAGLSLLHAVRAAVPDIPVVMLTGRGDEEVAVELMKAGAADYLPKAALTAERLATSLRHAVELARAAAAQRRAEHELRTQEALFRTLANSIPQLAWLSDHHGCRSWYNERWYAFTGMTFEESRDLGWQRVHHPDHLERVRASQLAAFERGEAWEGTFPLRRWDGTYRWFLARAVPVRNQGDSITHWVGTLTDITERHEAEQALRASEERFRRALEIETVGILFFTPDGKITGANDAFLRMGGYSREDVAAGRLRWDELTPPEWMPHALRAVEEFKATGRTTPYEKQYMRTDGSRWWGLSAATRLNEDEGVEFVLDISGRKQATEEALRQTQAELAHASRLTTMGELAASIAHEINQPLTAVVTNGNACLRWLARETPDLAEARAAVGRIIREAHRASEVIRQVRALVRKTDPQKVWLDLNGLIPEVVALVQSEARRHGVALRTALTAALPPVLGNGVQVQQVLLNLLLNGIEAMQPVTDRPRELLLRSQRHGADAVLVAVQDSGIGLDPERTARLFDAFVTTKPGGLGLGLAISRSIIEAHGGRLWASPNAGPGATFQFTLPTGGERM